MSHQLLYSTTRAKKIRVRITIVQCDTCQEWHGSHQNFFSTTSGEKNKCDIEICTVRDVSKRIRVISKLVHCYICRKGTVSHQNLYSAARVENGTWHIEICAVRLLAEMTDVISEIVQCDTCRERHVSKQKIYIVHESQVTSGNLESVQWTGRTWHVSHKTCTVWQVSFSLRITSKIVWNAMCHLRHVSHQNLYDTSHMNISTVWNVWHQHLYSMTHDISDTCIIRNRTP